MYFIPTDNVAYIIMIVIFMIIMTYPSEKISYDIYKGKIPNFIKNFPVHIINAEEVDATKKKVSSFLEEASRKLEAEIEIDQNDLNNLYTGGEVKNMFMPGNYFYYEIQKNRIIKKSILWPSISPNFAGYSSQIDSIIFLLKEDKFFEKSIVLEQDNRRFNNEILRSITCSIVLLLIFSLGDCKGDNIFNDRKTIKYKNFEAIIHNASSIKIEDDILAIRFSASNTNTTEE